MGHETASKGLTIEECIEVVIIYFAEFKEVLGALRA